MYESTILAFGAMALLMFVQLLIADVVGIKSKHIPGGAVPVDHKQLLFRTTRTVANTNESVAIFVLASLFCILMEASPAYTGYAAWAFVTARLVYALLYYSNIQLWRSVSFGISLLSLLALLLIGFLG
ncbi:MAG: hypothetical protein NPIRA05_15320 [Nitrospirales bacterium]|nr:MAG: hypothetical protein NPIRA05_15320 [Nitrospirales bacterium]